jgi:SAM-dependent methyltransferase
MAEAAPNWWQTGFGPAYLALYDAFLAERTPVEVDQIEALLQLRPPRRILDLPCGQGRHAIELARRGYQVTGVDVSPYMLGVARERADASGVRARWLAGDMREALPGETFDVVLNLFTSFGYFDDEADDRRAVRAAASMLAPGGQFLLEVINGQWIVSNFQERQWFTVGQLAVMERRSLDVPTRRMVVERTVSSTDGDETSVHAVRLYSGSAVKTMLDAAGFSRVELYGDWGGAALTPESLRVLAVGSMPQ